MTTTVPFRLCAALLAALAVTSCATTANYEKILQSWVGNSEDHLVESWGPPQRSYALSDGGEVIEYVRQASQTMGGYTQYVPMTTYNIVTVVMVVMLTAITQEQAPRMSSSGPRFIRCIMCASRILPLMQPGRFAPGAGEAMLARHAHSNLLQNR